MKSLGCKNSDDPSRCRGRPKAVPDDAQRHAIVDTARHLFVEKGYGATTTEEIASTCRISKQTLYRLFPGKPALFNAVIASMRRKWLNFPVSDELPLEDALEEIFCANITEEVDLERMELLRVAVVEGSHFPELHDAVHQCGSEVSRAELAGWLDKQCARGRIRSCDTVRAAGMLMDMIFGRIILKSTGALEWPRGAERVTHIRSCINVFLHGVCTGAPA